jgi:type IV pilus assembly protein PilN
MAKINLLPWREELRQQKQQEFLTGVGLAVLLTAAIMGAVHVYIEGLKEYQTSRNKMLQGEISVLDKKIEEIRDIETQKNKLLTKIEVIQDLQESRPKIVHLFDELPKSTPEGVYLTKFKQSGESLTMTGMAQSNARVSAYMRAIEASPWLVNPKLNVIQAKGKSNSIHMNDFTMLAQQGNGEPETQEEGVNKR